MLGLPRSTEVNRRVAKEKFYQNAALTPQTRELIKDQIESVIWRNKLADSTVGISAGENINEIQIFEIQLRQRGLDNRVLSAMAGSKKARSSISAGGFSPETGKTRSSASSIRVTGTKTSIGCSIVTSPFITRKSSTCNSIDIKAAKIIGRFSLNRSSP